MYGSWLLYVDDAQFGKIARNQGHAFMFAGRGDVIQQWKDWVKSDPASDAGMPGINGISICIVQESDQKVKFEQTDIVNGGAYFSGSGSKYAYLCWNQNRCPKKAVESAKEIDCYTGGEVKFLDMRSGCNNLHPVINEVTIQMVSNAIQTRGMVMKLATPGIDPRVPFKLSDLAANDVDLQRIQGMIAEGELVPEAPSNSMYNEWSEDEERKLKASLADVFGWSK